MGLIQSFSIDHTRIVPGIFTSRVDQLGNYFVTTYDIRLRRPNIDPVIDTAAMHSLEHIIATFLRNDPLWKDEIVYWGPMGCLTGFYLILKGNRASRELYDLVLKAFEFAGCTSEVPGKSPVNCGNYVMHDLEAAKKCALEFVAYLKDNATNPLIFEYQKSVRLKTSDGQLYYDS